MNAVPDEDYRVKPLELFFDLLFVFALTQVTGLLAADVSWEQVARGMVLLAALWWAWAGYTWVTTNIDPEEDLVRLVFFLAMAAWLIAGLAVPEAFGDHAVVFGGAYFVARLAHIALFYVAAGDDAGLRAAVTRSVPIWIFAPALIFGAAFLDGTAQGAAWGVALLVDYGSGLLGRGGGWRLHARHFAERHGLIIIVALGESIVAAGAGAADAESLATGTIVTAALAFAVTAAIWWIYFDVAAIVAEQRLRERTGDDQARQARDSYSYLHLPMVAGIVLFAFGAKKALGHYDDPLEEIPVAAVAGGVAMFLLAHVAFRLRNTRTLARPRVVVVAALIAVAVLGAELDALAAVALVAGLMIALVVYEALSLAEARRRVRHAAAH